MTLKNKILGTIATAYLGSVLVCGILSASLKNNFNYTHRRDNDQVVKVEGRAEESRIMPKEITISQGESFVSGRFNKDGNLEKIVLDIKPDDTQDSLLPLATRQILTQTSREIIESKEYLETIQRRQQLGESLLFYVMLSFLGALSISTIYKYSTATPEQNSEPFFHCR